jgi:hypothetical protein
VTVAVSDQKMTAGKWNDFMRITGRLDFANHFSVGIELGDFVIAFE